MSLHDWAAQLPNHQELLNTRTDKIYSALAQIDNGINTKNTAELMRGLKKAETIKSSAILLTPQETKEFVQRAMYVCTEAHQQWAELIAVARAINVATSMLTPRTPALVPLVSEYVVWEKLLRLASEFEPNNTTGKRLASEEVLKGYTDALGQLFRIARYYQRENSAEQVWNEFKFAVQVQDSPQMYEAQLHLYLFYPGGPLSQPATQEMFEQWMEAWGLVDHNSGWDCAWFGVVKRALKKNPQLEVDLHLNRFFGRFYANLKLNGNVNGGGESSSSTRKFSPWQQAMGGAVRFVKAAKLLVQLLHVGDAIKRLEHFVQSVHTFIHPSNYGSHAERLSSFLSYLCEAFAKRLGANADSLPKDTKKRFIACLYPLIEMGLYSKSLAVVASCQAALRHLSWLAPVTMANLTLDVVRQGLDPTNVSRSHQTAAGMKILTATIQPLVFGSQASRNVVLPELCDFLENSLPGLDPNDSRKTAVTLLMAYSVMSCVPLVSADKFTSSQASCSASFGIDDDNDDAMEVGLAFGNRLEEWGLAFFRRLFALAQSRGQRAKKGISAQMDNVIDFFFQETISLCYTQLVSRRRDALLEISQFLIQDAALPDAHHEATSFASGLVRVDPESALNELVPTLLDRVQGNGDAKTVAWALVVLGALVRKAGHFALKFAPQVHQAIIRSFAHKDSKVRYLGAKLIRRLARGLLATYPFQSSAPTGESVFDPVYEKHDLSVNWHVPNDQEVAFATNMLVEFKQLAFDSLLQASVTTTSKLEMDSSVTEKERTNHLLIIVFQSIRGGLTHLNRSNEQDVDRVIACTALLEQTSNIFGLKLCAKSLVLLASKAQGPKGGGNESYMYSYKAWTAWLRDISQNRAIETQIKQKARDAFAQTPSVGTGYPARPTFPLKHMMLRDYEFFHEKETYFASFPLVTHDTVLKPCGTLLNLCFHHSSAVRKCAQTHLEYVDLRCRFALREQVKTEVIPKLKSSKPEEFTGAIYLLRHGSALRMIGMNLDALDLFLTTALGDDNALEKLPAFRQAKAQERLARLVGSVLNRWQEILQVDPSPLCSKLVAIATTNKQGGGDWRTQLTVLTVIAILKPARAVNDDVARFVFDMTKHEMLPTRLASFFVLRTMLLAEEQQGESAKPHMRTLMQSLTQDQVTLLYTSAGSTLGQDRSSGEDQWSAGVGDNIKLVKTQVKPPKFPQLSSNSVSRDFHCSKVDLFASYCKYLPANVSLLPSLRELATEGESSKDRAERKLSACEMFAALLAIRPESTKEFFPILLRMLADLPNASNWCDAVTYIACFSKDRGQALLAEIQAELDRKSSSSFADSEPETDGERERGFSYTSNLLKVLGSVLEERREEISASMYAKFEQFLTHPYKAVRQAAATSFALFHMHCVDFDSERVIRTMLTIKDNKEGLESALCFVAVLVAVSPSKFILNEVLRPLLGPVVFEAQGHAEVETALMAKNVLHLCSTHLRCFAVKDTKLVVQFEENLIKDFATHAEWTKRRALCVFLRSFHALHATFLLGMGAGALVQRTSEDLLMDIQAEVRDAARLLLLSLLIAVPVSSLESAKDRYCRMVNNAKKRQQGILALTALVETSPYSVPSALPPSLMVLSKHVNHPLLGQQVKKTLSEFRRTHIDEWAEHHLKFSEEELSALEGVLFSPDYYA